MGDQLTLPGFRHEGNTNIGGAKAVALQACGLSYSRDRRLLFRAVDLKVTAGEVVMLHGANGVGKTTLLRCLAGALRPCGGNVLWFGRRSDDHRDMRILIGYLGHETGHYPGLTAFENLLFAARMNGLCNPAERTHEVLRAAGLQRHAHRLAGCMSRGMRQRLAIARTVLYNPRILLLDEPFTSLDGAGVDWLTELLCEYRERQGAVVISIHDDSPRADVGDRHLWLRAAQVYPSAHDCAA